MIVDVQINGMQAKVVLDNLALFEFTPKELGEIHKFQAMAAELLTREYLQVLADSRHDTAKKLHATPTGFWAQALESLRSASTASAATITMASPGLARAFRDVTIRPGPGSKYLTLPVHTLGYGERARDLGARVELFFLRTGPTGALILAMKEPGKEMAIPIYLLVEEVHQKQDRTLLPSDEGYLEAGVGGLDEYLDKQLGRVAA